MCGALAWWILRPVQWDDRAQPPPAFERARSLLEAGDLDAGARELRRALRRVRAPFWEERYRIVAARRLVDGGRSADAARVLPRPLPDGAPLAPHADLLRGRILLEEGRFEEAEAAARSASVPGFPGTDESMRLAARALEERGRLAEGIDLLGASSSWPLRLEAARLAAQKGETEDARARLAAIVLDSEDATSAERALDAILDLVPDPFARFSSAERVRVLETARRWTEAERPGAALRLLRAGRPPEAAALAPEGALEEAHALWRLGRDEEARTAAIRARNGSGEVKDGGIYLLARLDLARGRVGAWRAALESLARRPGASAWKLRALRDLAVAGEGVPSATTLARYRTYRTAAGDRADPTALLREFWAAWDLKRWREAEEGLERILAREDMPPGVRAAALYWAGRRLEAKGRRDEARRTHFAEVLSRFPNHYYAAIVERHLGRPQPTAPKETPQPPDPGACGSGGRWIEAARQLDSVGLWPEAADSYRAAARLAPAACARSAAVEAMGAALRAGSATDALEFADAAVGDRDACAVDAVPAAVWRLLYPAPSGDLVDRESARAGLDASFVAAVIRQESAFQPRAVSSAGARGLLQIMPAVGAEWARRLRLSGYHDDRLFEPEVNLRLGTAYLKALLGRFPFRGAALAAYNAGPSRAERWLLPSDREDAFVERIPIGETRLYVKRILTLERFYRIAWPDGFEREEKPPGS